MTGLEAIAAILDQATPGCVGVDCKECPFNDDIGPGFCWLHDNRDQAVKQMVIQAIIVESAISGDAERLSHTHIKRIPKDREIPEHYQLDPEPIDVIKSWGLDFCLGNVAKYLARAGHKEGESRDSDLHKAMNYLRLALEDEGK